MARDRFANLEKYTPMIQSRAWFMSRLYGIEFRELEAQGFLIFNQAKFRYNARRNFGTFLWICLSRGLMRFAQANSCPAKHTLDGTPIELWDGECLTSRHKEWNPRERLIWKETVRALSAEAQTIVELLLTSPTEILDLSGEESAKGVRDTLYSHLRHEGWRAHRIWAVFREIKELLRDL